MTKVVRAVEEAGPLEPPASGTDDPGLKISLVSVGETAAPGLTVYTETRAVGPN